jgi:Vitamin K-dependent gamma-carboxylase
VWRRAFSLDLRSLALFRIALGTVLLFTLISFLPDIDAFYTDRGILPRGALISEFGNEWAISVHLMSGHWSVQLALLLIAIVFAVGLIAGYRTRLCTAASWFLLSSLQVRNPVILLGGDHLLRLLLFWSIFVPLNGRCSLDQALNPSTRPPEAAHMSWGSQALMLQLCFMYWFTAALKWHPVWISEGSAIYYALNIDVFTTPLGRFLLRFPELLRLMTYGTVLLEFFGPFLVFSPVRHGLSRLLVVLMFIGFHAGLGLSMYLGNFAWVCAAGWLMFLPAEFWERAEWWGGERIPRWVATHRLWSSTFLRRVTPPPPRYRVGAVSNTIVLSCALLVLTWNLTTLPRMGIRLPVTWRRIASLTDLRQKWAMFAPVPLTDDGWYDMEGITISGARVDIWRGAGEPNDAKPADVFGTYRNTAWSEYLLNIWDKDFSAHRPYFGRYLCRKWNESHAGAERVNLLYINYVLEVTPPPGQSLPTPEKIEIWRQHCLENPPAR